MWGQGVPKPLLFSCFPLFCWMQSPEFEDREECERLRKCPHGPVSKLNYYGLSTFIYNPIYHIQKCTSEPHCISWTDIDMGKITRTFLYYFLILFITSFFPEACYLHVNFFFVHNSELPADGAHTKVEFLNACVLSSATENTPHCHTSHTGSAANHAAPPTIGNNQDGDFNRCTTNITAVHHQGRHSPTSTPHQAPHHTCTPGRL